MLAHSIDWIGNNKVLVPQDEGDMLLLLCPDFAAQDRARRHRRRRRAAHAARVDAHADRALARAATGRSSRSAATSRTASCRSRARPEQFLIAVAGGESGHHALYFCTFGLTWSVSVPFALAPTGSAGEVLRAAGAPVSGRRRCRRRSTLRCAAGRRATAIVRPPSAARRSAQLRRARPRRRRLGGARWPRSGLGARRARRRCSPPTSPEWLAAAFGVWRAGATLVPISTFVTARELGEILAHADVDVLDRCSRAWAVARLRRRCVDDGSRRGAAGRVMVLAVRRCAGRGRPPRAGRPRRCRRSRSRASSTPRAPPARPKGVMLSRIAPSSPPWRRPASAAGLTPDDVLLSTLPLFWVAGLVIRALPTLAVGLRAAPARDLHRRRRRSPRCAAHRPTGLHLRPPQVGQLLAPCRLRSSAARRGAPRRRPGRVVRAASRCRSGRASSPATA